MLPVTPSTTEEIIEIIVGIYNNNEDSGPSSIPFKILKTGKHSIANQLYQVFNLSFNIGISPACEGVAKVISVLKKGTKLDCSNH